MKVTWTKYYAPDGAGTGAVEAPATEATESAAEQMSNSTPSKDFEEILMGNKAYQAEFDRRLTKALETQKTKLEAAAAEQVAAAKTEAEKLAKMNAEQKLQYEQDKRLKDLESREAAIAKRELEATAKDLLAQKGLPLSLADVLNYASAEACNTSIEGVERAFREALAEAVDNRLKGGSTLTKAKDSLRSLTREDIAKMSPEEINTNWEAVQAAMSKFN